MTMRSRLRRCAVRRAEPLGIKRKLSALQRSRHVVHHLEPDLLRLAIALTDSSYQLEFLQENLSDEHNDTSSSSSSTRKVQLLHYRGDLR